MVTTGEQVVVRREGFKKFLCETDGSSEEIIWTVKYTTKEIIVINNDFGMEMIVRKNTSYLTQVDPLIINI